MTFYTQYNFLNKLISMKFPKKIFFMHPGHKYAY